MRPCGFPIMLQQGPETYILFLYNLDYSSSFKLGYSYIGALQGVQKKLLKKSYKINHPEQVSILKARK